MLDVSNIRCEQGDPWYSSPDLREGDCQDIYAVMLNAAPAAPGVSTVEDAGFPAGAIVNGRTLADRLEAYLFQSDGRDLRLCADWVEFRRCFEYLAEWVGRPAPAAGDALAPGTDLEAAAKKLAECMDYPWSHMLEKGRAQMRLNAQAVIDAAIAAQRKGVRDALEEITPRNGPARHHRRPALLHPAQCRRRALRHGRILP
ncbi:hypothetical protein WJ972_15590 [Achromobacter insuavis]